MNVAVRERKDPNFDIRKHLDFGFEQNVDVSVKFSVTGQSRIGEHNKNDFLHGRGIKHIKSPAQRQYYHIGRFDNRDWNIVGPFLRIYEDGAYLIAKKDDMMRPQVEIHSGSVDSLASAFNY